MSESAQESVAQPMELPSNVAVAEAHRAIAAYHLVSDFARLRSADSLAIIFDAAARALRRGAVTSDQLADMRNRISAMDKQRKGGA